MTVVILLSLRFLCLRLSVAKLLIFLTFADLVTYICSSFKRTMCTLVDYKRVHTHPPSFFLLCSLTTHMFAQSQGTTSYNQHGPADKLSDAWKLGMESRMDFLQTNLTELLQLIKQGTPLNIKGAALPTETRPVLEPEGGPSLGSPLASELPTISAQPSPWLLRG